MEEDFTISPKIVERLAKEIDPSLFHADATAESVFYCEVNNPKDEDPYSTAEEIARKTGARLVHYRRGDIRSQLSFSLGKDKDQQLAKRRDVIGEVTEKFGLPPTCGIRDPDYSEGNIKRLKEGIKEQLLRRAKLSMPTAEELKRYVRWF